jgi:hypothetical protein
MKSPRRALTTGDAASLIVAEGQIEAALEP